MARNDPSGKKREMAEVSGDASEGGFMSPGGQKNQPTHSKSRSSGHAGTPGSCPIVGIGASAGGLEALTGFFKAMTLESGMAFVLVVHLDPTHVSLLPDLLQHHTKMKVSHAMEGVAVEPDHVYVIPPNVTLTIRQGRLRLGKPGPARSTRLPINGFFLSLAEDQGPNAVGIVLSGTGSDGTGGITAIKHRGGLVLVQDPESAGYDGMPRNAAATGHADSILAPGRMPERLMAWAGETRQGSLPLRDVAEDKRQHLFREVAGILRSKTGHDFSQYKQNTVGRRIERRMQVQQISSVDDYLKFLRENEKEADTLFGELLIGVTNFFRDPEAFEILQDKMVPRIIKAAPDGSTIRVWVPGCATGEEAYSLAILLNDCMEQERRNFHVQIFGTDLDSGAIDSARVGLFGEGIVKDVGAERIARYFKREEDGRFRVIKSIREMLVFAQQNLIRDPPFTRLDIVSCRNLLIYLDAEIQKKLLPMFQYSLKPGGILFLGSSETIGTSSDLFSVESKKWKIYSARRTGSSQRIITGYSISPRINKSGNAAAGEVIGKAGEQSPLHLVEAILRESKAPPCAIINEIGDLIYVHGRTGRFLEPPEGRVTVNLVALARPGLKAELAVGIRRAGTHKEEVAFRGLQVDSLGGECVVDVTVKPILEPAALCGHLMVVFAENTGAGNPRGDEKALVARPDSGRTATELETELRATRENLQTTIEELETLNEELKSANEELQSNNEELQSTNEELETSKEELQSLNEESATVNNELQLRLDELARTNDDLKNLLDSTEIGTIFLDAELCVRRFTPRSIDIVPLTAADIGRPIHHFATQLQATDLAGFARLVLDDLVVRNVHVKGRDGRHFLMRVRPYRTTSNLIDGVVITFEDTTQFMKAEEVRRLAVVVRDSNDAITLQDDQGRIIAWNHGAERMYGYSETEALDMNILQLIPGERGEEEFGILRNIFQGKANPSYLAQRLRKDGNVVEVWVTATILPGESGDRDFLATTERDLNELKRQG